MSSEKRAFLVLGPESSGTRLLTRILISGGCHGSDEHVQPFDNVMNGFGDLDPVVLRRSEPHGGISLYLSGILYRFGDRKATILVTVRDWSIIARSQVYWGHSKTIEEAMNKIADAYRKIFSEILANNVNDYRFVVYEELVLAPYIAQMSLLSSLGLRVSSSPEDYVKVYDGNDKYQVATYQLHAQ